MRTWFKQLKVTEIAMESTGVYWRPVWNVLQNHEFRLLLERELREPDDFAIVNLKTTAYKESDSKISQVFVVGSDGSIEQVAEQSYTITAMKDRPESESLLIIVNTDAIPAIESCAFESKTVSRAAVPSAHRFEVPQLQHLS